MDRCHRVDTVNVAVARQGEHSRSGKVRLLGLKPHVGDGDDTSRID